MAATRDLILPVKSERKKKKIATQNLWRHTRGTCLASFKTLSCMVFSGSVPTGRFELSLLKVWAPIVITGES